MDIPEPRHTNILLKWLKQSGLETPDLGHLKRIRKLNGTTTLLLTSVKLSPDAPPLPSDIELPEPYTIEVPRNPALTMESLKAKATFWPTIYAPRKKGELEPMSRGQVRWAWEAMRTVVQEAKLAKENGEVQQQRSIWRVFTDNSNSYPLWLIFLCRTMKRQRRRRSCSHRSVPTIPDVLRRIHYDTPL